MMQLRYVFRRACEITWRHKTLWLFGFLVSLGTVGTRVGTGSGGRWGRLAQELPLEAQRAIVDFLSSPCFTVAMVVLALLALIIGIGLALLSALGRAALVDQVRAVEEHGAVNLRAGWQAGWSHLWPVFLIRLLLGLPVAVMTLIGGLSIVGTWFLVGGQEWPEAAVPGGVWILLTFFACSLPAICLAVLLSVPTSVLQRLAVRACVLERCGVQHSITRAWTMLWEHLVLLAFVWLSLAAVGIGVMVLISLPLVLVAMSLVAAALLAAFISPPLSVVLVSIIGLVLWLVGAAFHSVVETLMSAVWTLVYRELAGLGLTGE
jgi:hypothetical protein